MSVNLLSKQAKNYEYSFEKLLFHGQKCKSILHLTEGKLQFDETFPLSIEIHLTNRCNLQCPWCVDRGIRKKGEEMDFSTLVKFLDNIKDKDIALTIEGGGEPTVYGGFDEFILEAAKRNIHLGLITNGVNRINKHLIKYFKWIRVSLDATNADEYKLEKGKDYFDTVISNLEYLCKNKQETLIGVSYVITNRNYKKISSLLNKLQEIGVDNIQIRAVEESKKFSVDETIMDYIREDILKNFKASSLYVNFNDNLYSGCTENNRLPCIAHSLRSIIHADGNVYLCEKRRHDPAILGNINDVNFSDIWNSQKHKDISKKLLDAKNQSGCEICRITKFNKMFLEINGIKTKEFI